MEFAFALGEISELGKDFQIHTWRAPGHDP